MTNATVTARRSAVTRGYARQAPRSEHGSEAAVRQAVIYLRVSSPSQVKTNYNPSLLVERSASWIIAGC